jgi:drug/metabolite transporter (DMT)-like permease
MGYGMDFRDGGDLFGIAGLHLSPGITYTVYLAIDVLLVSIANVLYFLALQVSPLSLCVPFLAFTPIFLIPTGWIMLRELPSATKLLGVVLVFVGSVLMHRRLFSVGWWAPVKAIVQEPGSRYMLLVALIFSITNPLEKKLVLISDVYTQAFAFGIGLCLFFLVLTLFRKEEFGSGLRGNVRWVSAAGAMDGISLLLQFASYHYIDVVISISIKRAGIVLAVFFGWLFFRERGIPDKVIASSVMLVGVLIIYLPVSGLTGAVMTVIALIGAVIALYLTRSAQPEAERAPV